VAITVTETFNSQLSPLTSHLLTLTS